MTVHVCRDLVLGPNGAATGSYDTMWALMVFMQGVLGYQLTNERGNLVPPSYTDFTVNYFSMSAGGMPVSVSSSILSIHSASCFITGYGDHTLVQFSTDAVNLLKAAYPVGWASGSGAWPGYVPGTAIFAGGYGDPFLSDWIAIKSIANPKVNSGIFQIINASLWLSGNCLEIDYRTTSPTVQETTNYLSCSLWLPSPSSDTNTGVIPSGTGSFYGITRGPARMGAYWPFDGATPAWAGNGNSNGYQGNGLSTYPRAVLTSPHSTGYQVRVAIETPQDVSFGGTLFASPGLSAIPGFSGSNGDFQTGSYAADEAVYHLHVPQWINYSYAQAHSTWPGVLPMFDNFANTNDTVNHPIQYRFYAWGDDSTGTVFAATRNVHNVADYLCAFGIPADEPPILPSLPVQRLFAYGTQCPTSSGTLGWSSGWQSQDGIGGIAYSLFRWLGPISCVASSYTYVATCTGDVNHIRFNSAAGDTPFLQGSELVTVDLVAGTLDQMYTQNNNVANLLSIEPRRLGRFPFARQGRAQFNTQVWSTDASLLWFHLAGGVYLPWGGVVGL